MAQNRKDAYKLMSYVKQLCNPGPSLLVFVPPMANALLSRQAFLKPPALCSLNYCVS